MRMYAVFEKGERLRHIGHLDMLRTMQRALRRSGLPVAYSKGFNPHMLLGFASALSVGAVGKHELMEMQMDADVAPEEVLSRLQEALPPDVRVLRTGVLPEGTPPLMSLVAAADWEMTFLGETAGDMARGMGEMLSRDTVMAVRKTKSGEKEDNIRPAVLLYEPRENGCRLMLSQEAGTTCKPSMVLAALGNSLGCPAPRVSLTRNSLMMRLPDGSLVRMEEAL